VVFPISATVAPFGRPINARIWAPWLWARGAAVGFARAACAFAFDFFYGAALVLPPAAVFGLPGAPSFLLAPFFAEAGAAPLARPVQPSWRPCRGFQCGSCCSSILFCARLAHDDLSLWCAPNANEN
jgi:hypothetical protein